MNIIGDYEAHQRDAEFDRKEDKRLSRKPYWDMLRLSAIGRVAGNDREMSLYFSRPITDDEMRACQDAIADWATSLDAK
jgi:hypothetical protein